MVDGNGVGSRALSPPYVSFVTFKNFLEWLKDVGVPVRMDRSFWERKLAGGTGAQMMTAFRFLGLLDGERPTLELQGLVSATSPENKQLLGAVLRSRYQNIPWTDLDRATPKMIEEALETYGIEGHTLRKAGSFFINGCKEAGIALPPSLGRKARTKGIKAKAPPRSAKGAEGDAPPSESDVKPSREPAVSAKSWEDRLLEKFPTFDLNWSEELKGKWFDAFDKLMGRKSF
ncbi:MAG: hypothetical protein EXR60_07115 [Dehalococcoidia bacterium]|nr:hypothetical protein [Dehalococcoidia bacterium]